MDIRKIVASAAATLLLAGSPALAGESSAELGKKLFNDPALGGSANAKSCNSCHPDGEKLEKSGERKDLAELINRCITGPLEGAKLDGRSVEMRSLKLYLQSLAKK